MECRFELGWPGLGMLGALGALIRGNRPGHPDASQGGERRTTRGRGADDGLKEAVLQGIAGFAVKGGQA